MNQSSADFLPLSRALAGTSWRLLAQIGRRNGLHFPSNIPKADLLARLTETLSGPAHLARVWATLPPPEQRLVTDILRAGGQLSVFALRPEYGPFRSAAHILRLASATPLPHNAPPLSPAERLLLRGLLYHHPPTGRLFIPAPLSDYLFTCLAHQVQNQPQPQILPGTADVTGAMNLVYDLALLLGLCHRQPVTPITGKWLPPRLLANWDRRCSVAPQHPAARSELQTGRRRFIHFLAESAAFLDPALTPTPAAGLWLKAQPEARIEALRRVWLTAPDEIWLKFRLPGYDRMPAPHRLIAPLETGLHRWACGQMGRLWAGGIPRRQLSRFADELLAGQPQLLDFAPPNPADRPGVLIDALAELIAGPLVWLGMLAETALPEPASLKLTPWGLHWLGLGPAPQLPPAQPFSLSAHLPANPLGGVLVLTAPETLPDPAHAFTLSALEEGESGQSPEAGAEGEVRVTAAGFIRALHSGWAAPALVEALRQMIGRSLSRAEKELLKAWAAHAGKITIRPMTVLETADPAVLARLKNTRRGRSLIVRTLTDRLAAVDGYRLDQLVRRLTEQEGVPPQVTAGDNRHPGPGIVAGQSHVWLALQVYQALDEFIDLPVRLPQNLADDIAAGLNETEHAAAVSAATQTVDRLKQALIGRMPFPPWPEEGLPEAESLPLIERALSRGQVLVLHYYALSTDTVTRREVEPYRLERVNNTPYLIGFCRRAQAERTFRLDRVRAVEVLQESYGSQQGWSEI